MSGYKQKRRGENVHQISKYLSNTFQKSVFVCLTNTQSSTDNILNYNLAKTNKKPSWFTIIIINSSRIEKD